MILSNVGGLLSAGGAIGAGIGFVVGAFTPAIGRKIKGLFVKQTQAANKAVQGAASSVAKKL